VLRLLTGGCATPAADDASNTCEVRSGACCHGNVTEVGVVGAGSESKDGDVVGVASGTGVAEVRVLL
jgi:hypothetical protein